MAASHDDAYRLPIQFGVRVRIERRNDLRQMPIEQHFEIARAEVARANEQQFPALVAADVRRLKLKSGMWKNGNESEPSHVFQFVLRPENRFQLLRPRHQRPR